MSTLKNIYHTASRVIPNDTKKVEIVEIQDEKQSNEMLNGSQSEFKSKSDSRWSDNKNSIKKEPIDDSKSSIKKESIDSDKEKK